MLYLKTEALVKKGQAMLMMCYAVKLVMLSIFYFLSNRAGFTFVTFCYFSMHRILENYFQHFNYFLPHFHQDQKCTTSGFCDLLTSVLNNRSIAHLLNWSRLFCKFKYPSLLHTTPPILMQSANVLTMLVLPSKYNKQEWTRHWSLWHSTGHRGQSASMC